MHKPIYRFDIEQNTDEWENIKFGKFSASQATNLLMDKSTKGYNGLINKIVEERITLERCENDTFKGNWATDRGHILESDARLDFEIRTLQVVKLVGVVIYDDWTLCSPDGLINDDKLHQIKCPIFSTQKEYLTLLKLGKSPISTSYYKQLQFELFVSGRTQNIFTSYHPNIKTFDYPVNRDEVMIANIKSRLEQAKTEVKEEIKRIKNF